MHTTHIIINSLAPYHTSEESMLSGQKLWMFPTPPLPNHVKIQKFTLIHLSLFSSTGRLNPIQRLNELNEMMHIKAPGTQILIKHWLWLKLLLLACPYIGTLILFTFLRHWSLPMLKSSIKVANLFFSTLILIFS